MSGAIPAWAFVGAKVVLIDLSAALYGIGTQVESGDICVITAITKFGSVPAVRADEVNGKWRNELGEWTRLDRFRPLISQADDISTHFQQLLSTPVNVGEDA